MGAPVTGRTSRTAVRLLAVAAVAGSAGMAVAHVVHPPWHHLFDLSVYRGGVRWWLHGRPLYDYHKPHSRYGFTYPPFAALLMTPLAVVPQPVAAALVVGTSAVLVVAGVGWLVTPVARRAGWTPWFAAGLVLPVAFLLEPVRETLGFGQVNILIAALVLTDVVAVQRGRRWAGIGIGLAAAVKLTPAVFVVHLLLTGRRRAAGVAVVTFLAASLGTFAIAPGTSWRYWGGAVWQVDRVGSLFNPNNDSLLSALARLSYPAQPNRAVWLVLVAVVAVVALRRAARAARQGDELVGVTLTGLTGCLVSPISWGHHLVWVLPAVVVLLDVAAGAPLADRAPQALQDRPRATAVTAAVGAAAVTAVFCASLPWYFAPHRPGGAPRADLAGLLGQDGYVAVLLALVLLLPARAPSDPAGRSTSARLTAARDAARRTARPRPGGSSPR
jgi:alpha-1,2-mannosyltransferase